MKVPKTTKELYEIREKALKDEISMINGAKLEAKLEDAVKMIQKGFNIEDIIEITGLKKEDIQKLYEINKEKTIWYIKQKVLV